MPVIKKILVPTDCSDFSRSALIYAIEFTRVFKAKMVVMSVIAEPSAIGFGDARFLSDDVYEKLRDDSDRYHNKQLNDFWNNAGFDDVEPELVLLKGDPFSKIIEYAKKTNVDLIIMGTHGRTGLLHILMGSVAEKVVRYSTIPVLTIKSKLD